MEFFRIFFALCLILQVLSVPVKRSVDDFCTGEQNLNYEQGQSYRYNYKTDTSLYINDISDEAKSSLELKASVVVTPLGQCNYLLSLDSASLTGESIDDSSAVVAQLTGNGVVFRMNSEGELDSDVKFASGDEAWSRNIKRAIVSAFQIKSFSKLKESEQEPETRSSVVYETDVLGKCRTTYSASADGQAQEYTLSKKKALQRCTLSTYEKEKFLGVQFVPYAQTPEFYEGRVFIEDYGCTSTIAGGLITSVECKEVSQFKPGSRGIYGVQAHVSQTLSYTGSAASSASDVSSFESASIAFEYFNAKGDRVETENFSAEAFADQVCANALDTGLANEHAKQFKDLVFTMRDWSADQMVAFYRSSEAKCALAGLTASQAIVMAKDDNSVEAALTLIDQDAFKSQKYITEYPLLTALARNPDPSLPMIKRFKSYLTSKTDDFDYYNKLSLVYSTLVRTYCKQNECSKAQLNEFSSVFAQGVEKCDVVALKSVGNIGGFANPTAMAACAQKDKTVEQQVAVMESTRNFKCEDFENAMDKVSSIFTDGSRDTEVRIAAFLAIVRCSETSEKVNKFSSVLADFLLAEEDQQVISFVIDYGKEHGLTKILNPVLNDPRVRAKFAVNFKTTSWNNFKYTHNVLQDAGVEVETSVIYTPQTWVPRSIKLNMTTHAFGASVNWMEANLRLEGLDEVLKAAIVDKLTSPEIVAKLTKDPEQLLDILKIVADKLQYKKEAAKLTFSIRVYGADIFYSRLDSKDEFMRLANFLRSPRETILYRQVETIKNIFVIDTEIRQPLLNGLSFNRYLDISASALLSKASSKQQGENGLEYHVNNFWSGSMDFRGVFDVAVNAQNKVSLKKTSFANARLRLNVEGSKKEGSYKYNMHLSPMETIPLVTVDGQFYKLGKNSAYQKVTEFKTARKVYSKCNTDAFQETFAGLQLCMSVDRPEFGSLYRIIKQRRNSDLEEDFQAFFADLAEDGEFEADNNNNLKRPTIFLAGPYHYELQLNNPELVKTIVFDLDFERDEAKSDVTLLVSTVSKSGAEVKRGELVYSRQRLMTYKGYHGKMNLKLTNLQTSDVRLNFQLEGQVHPDRVFKLHFEVENKILRPFHHKLLVNRDNTRDTIVPVWNVEILYDSQRRGPKRYNLKLELTPQGRDITGQFFLEARDDMTEQKLFRPIEGSLALISQSNEATSYTVDVSGYNKLREAELKITGTVEYAMFTSDVNLFIDYRNTDIVFPKPANIRLGHMIDMRPGAKSNMRFHVEHSLRRIDHGVQVNFSADPVEKKINYLEFEISKPGLAQPASLFFEKTETDEDNTYTKDVKFGIRNISRQLSSGVLVKVDGDQTLRSLIFHTTKVHVRGKSIDAELTVLKNGNAFVVIKRGVFGELEKVRASADELSKTSFGGNLYVKVLENSGAVSAQLDLEASKSAKTHAAEFKFKTENLFKILSKLASVEAKMSSAPGAFNAQIEYKKLGEVKSFKLYSTSGLRFTGKKAEFDIGYEKRLASGDVITGSGTGSFKFDNFKNFELAANVPGHYWSTVSVKNTRSASQADQLFAYHNFQLENAHLDYEPYQNRFRVYIENTMREPVGKFNFLVDLRNGPLNMLENREALSIFQQVSSMNTFAQGNLFISKNSLNAKSARFNLDFEKKSDFIMDPRDRSAKYDASTSLKAPAFLTAPGQLIFVKHDLSVKYNPVGQSLEATNNYNTNSMLFGRVVRVFNAQFKRAINEETDMVNANLKIDYNMPLWGNEDLKTWNFDVKHDAHKRTLKESFAQGWKFNVRVQQNRFPVFHSRLIVPGESFTIADCVYDETVARSMQPDNFAMDLEASLRCDGALIKHEQFSVKRSGWQSGYPSFRLQLAAKSDFHPDRLFKFAHDKFSAKHGLIAVGVNMDSKRTISNEFFYDRSVTGETDKKAHYRWTTSFGEELNKVCDVNLEKTIDNGFLTMDCRLNSTKFPGKEIAYGFNAESKDLQKHILGNRNYKVKMFIPGRVLMFEYERNYPSYFDGNDDDEDANNEREFNATAKFFWNESNDKTQVIHVVAKRDNYAVGKSTTFVEFVNTPNFESLKFSADKSRTFDETNILLTAEYLMKTGAANRLTVNGILKSDLDTNSLSVETNLDRPSFNTKYENRFNKWNGKLDFLGIRVGKVLKLTIDKESQQGQRMIAMNLVNPDESRYTFEGTSNLKNDVYTVEGSLSESGKALSNVVSKFDAKNNVFTVVVKGLATGNNYKFNFGVFSETIADASVLDLNTNKVLGKTSVQIVKSQAFDEPMLVVNMRWNRFWRQIISDIQGGNDEDLATQSSDYNSYFGDVYATVTEDLKPVVKRHREERQLVKQDFQNLAMLLADFYSNFLDARKKAAFDRYTLQQATNALINTDEAKLPIYKKALRAYNNAAISLTALSMKVRTYNKNLSRYIPRLPTYEYNQEESEFQNNLVVRRPTLNAKNFYQFNQEYRDYLRKAGANFLKVKGNLIRSNLGGMGIKALVNKYKYRSLSDYTVVGHVFNKRNMIGFDGEAVVLQSRCRYLLAHETKRNSFSVILNFEKKNKQDFPVSVHAYGSKSVDIGYDRAAIDDVNVALPHVMPLGEGNGFLAVTRHADSVCVEVNKDLKVCCYDDSKSCTVATTRWFKGRLNGLLGKADSDADTIDQQDWYLSNRCRYPDARSRKPSDEAVRTCYGLFGRHKSATFKDALQTVNPDSWRSVCESVLTASIKYKCTVIRAFVHHVQVENVHVNVPNECMYCKIGEYNYAVGQSVPAFAAGYESNFASGSDVVLVKLPCKKQTGVDMEAVKENLEQFLENPENRYYVVVASNKAVSVVQSADGKDYNVEFSAVKSPEENESVDKETFIRAMYTAGSLLTQRLAQHRHIVIESCGNSMPYRLNSLFFLRKLSERNIVVHSVGDYKIKNLDWADEDVSIHGYGYKHIFNYINSENESGKDDLSAYNFDHTLDMPARLAVKTGGLVLVREGKYAAQNLNMVLNENPKTFTYNVKTCERLDSLYGDLTDFKYTRKEVNTNGYFMEDY